MSEPSAEDKLLAYIDEQIVKSLAEATACPGCGTDAILEDDPAGPGVWCWLCGYRRPTALPTPPPPTPTPENER